MSILVAHISLVPSLFRPSGAFNRRTEHSEASWGVRLPRRSMQELSVPTVIDGQMMGPETHESNSLVPASATWFLIGD